MEVEGKKGRCIYAGLDMKEGGEERNERRNGGR
jgi:hypothetical protein